MTDRYDAIIIGAGVIGAAIALDMARSGYRTLNLDKLPAAGYGSTSNTCAIIRTHYSTLEGTALAYESLLHWADWPRYLGATDERGLADFVRSGMVIIRSATDSYERHVELHEQLGIDYEIWDVATLQERLPFYDMRAFHPPRRPDDPQFGESTSSSVPGAVFMPNAGYVNDPQLATHNLQRAAEAHGAEFLFGAAVTEVRRASGRVAGVTLADGRSLDAPVVVNAAGPHSFLINRMAGIGHDMTVTTRPLRHEVHYLPRPEGYDAAVHGFFTSDADIGGYTRPEVGDLLLIGSQDPACDPPDWIEDPDTFDREVTPEQWRAQVYRMALRVPGLPIPTKPKGVADLYDVTEDWIPIYDRSSLDGFYLAIGTSGNQFKNAPMVGKLVTELVTACEAGHDHDTNPVRVVGRYTDLTFDLGFYSRHRTPNRDSSLSVLG